MKNAEELEGIIEELMGILHRHGVRVELEEYEIVNVTAKLELRRRINLVEAAEKLNGIHDPDYRPYVIAEVDNTKIIVSQNGKIVILEGKSIDSVYFILLHRVLSFVRH